MLKGVDISKWNGSIDFSKLKEQVDFVILRAGYGRLTSQKDERFEEYYAACERYGIPKGCYWASYATSGPEAVQEANAFLYCVKGKKFEYPVMFDYEAFPGAEGQKNQSVARAVITSFMDTVKNAGYYVGLYSYYSMFRSYIPSDMQDGRYDIWLAHYASYTSYTGHKIWQYSSSGRLNGIPCEFDMNYCYVDNYPEIIKKGGYNGYAKNGEVITPAPVVVKKPTNVTYPIDSSTTTYEQKHYAYNDKTQLSKHFNVQEFKCKCGKQHDIIINTRLVAGLEKLFEKFDCSMIIVNSGYRCPEYDTNMNGFAGKHSVGDAADVVFYDKNKAVISTKKISCAAQDMEDVFGGIANINKTYTAIHLDVRQGYRWLGNEVVSNNTVTKDFYSYYGLSKEDVYGSSTPVVSPEPVVETKKEDTDTAITAGKEVKLSSTRLYASASASRYSSKKTGTYYVYSDEVIKGRIRITNKKENVGKTPLQYNVTGWVNVSDIK
jgi:GH25 family lysozyme M1 (1,4-beta-N-acetylmuramidase)